MSHLQGGQGREPEDLHDSARLFGFAFLLALMILTVCLACHASEGEGDTATPQPGSNPPPSLEDWNTEHKRLIAAEKNLDYLQQSIAEARVALKEKIERMEIERAKRERAELIRQTKGYLAGFLPEKRPVNLGKELDLFDDYGTVIPEPKK